MDDGGGEQDRSELNIKKIITRFMKQKATLYIDESGKSSLKEQKNNPFIMTGVIIDDSEISSIEGFFNYIKRKYKISLDLPFHSYHVFEHPEEKLSDNKLFELSKNLADFISLIPAQVKVIGIDKQEFKNALGVQSDKDFKGTKERKRLPEFPYRVMSSALFEWFARYLNEHNFIGQIICDSRRGADKHLLSTLNQCKDGDVPYFDNTVSKKIANRITAICFSEKNFLSGGLEITDLISFVTYFKVRRLITANKQIGIDKLWEKIRDKINFLKIDEEATRRFFGLKKNEVHKYLKT